MAAEVPIPSGDDVLAIDARHYQRAATEWLAGGDPWAVAEGGIPFAAGPHTLLEAIRRLAAAPTVVEHGEPVGHRDLRAADDQTPRDRAGDVLDGVLEAPPAPR